MMQYTLLVLHKLEHSFAYYDVDSGKQSSCIQTREYPHEICLSPDRTKIYIAEMGVRGIESDGPGGHTVAVFDLAGKKQIGHIDTGKYDRPHGLATFGQHLYVTSESTRHLLVYNLESGKLVRAVPLDQDCAHMVSISPDGLLACTANIYSNTITAVDTRSLEVLKHIPVPERPEGMVFSPDGSHIYCVCREAKSVAVVDREKGIMVDRIETGHGPVRLVISPDGSRLTVPLFHAASVQVVDTVMREVISTIPVGPHPAGTCMSPDGRMVFISCEDENLVYVFDTESMQVVQKINTGDGADSMVCLLSSELN